MAQVHDHDDDKIVTRFCQAMTSFCVNTTPPSAAFGTPVNGRGEGADIEATLRRKARCRRCAVFFGRSILVPIPTLCMALSMLVSCGQEQRQPPLPGDRGPRQSSLAQELTSPAPEARNLWASRYYDGYVAETLHGDMASARAAYEDVVAEAGSVAPQLAARAALRLAEIEALAGRRRKALELMARASALGRENLEIVEQADRLHARLGSLRAEASDVRGPPMRTALESVSGQAGERFARAEELFHDYYRVRIEPRLEQLRAGVRAKENATDEAVRAYRTVIALGEPRATVAAEFRIASLYHDLALSLMFDLPPELDPSVAARLKRSLKASAIGHLRRAMAAYRRSLEAEGESRDPSSERWTSAAKLGLRSVEDLLGGIE